MVRFSENRLVYVIIQSFAQFPLDVSTFLLHVFFIDTDPFLVIIATKAILALNLIVSFYSPNSVGHG